MYIIPYCMGPIGSPIVDSNCDLLVVLNRPSLDKYLPELGENGVLIYDSSTIKDAPAVKPGQKAIALNTGDIAEEFGNLKCANAVMLGAIGAMLSKYYLTPEDAAMFQETAEAAIAECFAGKDKIIGMNIEACKLGFDKMQAVL
jgi:Pyruvate/2-oxoacid:ferredoxin oxidoreductase gamma subunit